MARREAARDREGSPELLRLAGGGDVMGGGGDDSFAAAKARWGLVGAGVSMQWHAGRCKYGAAVARPSHACRCGG